MAEVGFEFGATAIDKAIDGLCSIFKKGKDIASAELEICFKKYLKNAYKSYNNVKTLVSRDTPREIIGNDSIYVNVGVKYKNKRTNKYEGIDTATIESLLKLKNHILIKGTGGAGKTMLMKHFFVNTIKNEFYIPVFVRLNKISEQRVDDISIYELIYSAIKEFSDDVSNTAFEHSLENGKYLFLFDGFDEIIGSHSIKASIAINEFCNKYPDNPCIVTSRPGSDLSQLKNFSFVEMQKLNKKQAVELASKLGMDDEKTREFCKQLYEELFYEHKEFAENPLLLSMMFLTFLENGSVPDKILDFYDRAYNALYNNHDNFKDGYFKRTFKSSLKPDEFKNVFTHFCFQSYMAEKYNFTENEIIDQIKKSMNKCRVEEVQAKNYLNDLIKSVCLIVEEGTHYVFAHRTFQAYFAALYTEKMNDDTQKKLFNRLLSKEQCNEKEDYYKILIQLMGDKFAENALEEKLRSFDFDKPFTEDFMIKVVKDSNIVIIVPNKEVIALEFMPSNLKNYFELFEMYRKTSLFQKYRYFSREKTKRRFIDLCKKSLHGSFNFGVVPEIKTLNTLNQNEKREFYLITIQETRFDKFLQSIHDWLIELDEKRKKLEESTESDNWYEDF